MANNAESQQTTTEEILRAVQKQMTPATEPAFAVFDFDNTCIVHDIGEAVFFYQCRNGLLRDATLLGAHDQLDADYHERVFRKYFSLLDAGDVKTAYLLPAQAFSGLTPDEAEQVTELTIAWQGTEFGQEKVFGRELPHGLAVRPTVKDLMRRLPEIGVEPWIVSSSPEPVLRASLPHFGYDARIVGVRNVISNGQLTSEIEQPCPIIAGKVDCIRGRIHPSARPLLAVGDSMNDLPMLEYARNAAVIGLGGELESEARSRGWLILGSSH